MLACRVVLWTCLQVWGCGATTISTVVEEVAAVHQPVAATRDADSSSADPANFQEFHRSSLVRRSLEVKTGTASICSALIAAFIFLFMTFVLACILESASSSKQASLKAYLLSMIRPDKFSENVFEPCDFPDSAVRLHQRDRLEHLRKEQPIHAQKKTAQAAITEATLESYIRKFFDRDRNAEQELQCVLRQRRQGETPANGWWSWSHPDPLSISMQDLMTQFHCDGLLDWSRISSAVLAHTYFQIIVTSGLGSESMLHEGTDEDWIESLHRDVMWDCSLRGAKHLFFSKVDTFLVGCIGRKRVVLLPPQSLPQRHSLSANVSRRRCDAKLLKILKMGRSDGWKDLEEYAVSAGGNVFTVCPGTFCHIPAGWWHMVQPVDDLTVVLSPSFLQGCWKSVDLDE